MTAPRPHFSSSFGVLMTFIGVAVGLGNVWRFPYMTAAFGGGAFLFVYLVLLGAFGIPAIMAELTLGRLTRRGPVGAFRQIGMPGGRTLGWALFVTVFMAVSYYMVIVGWVLRYFLVSVAGRVGAITPAAFFDELLAGVAGQFVMTSIVVVLVFVVLALGIRKGVERTSIIGMPLLFLLLLVLIGRSLTLPGAGEGLRFYLLPDFSKINIGVVTAALGQVFFSLSLGGTFLLTYASYLPRTTNLKTAAIAVGVGETLAAILAGLVIVPAAVSLGIELNSGPPLTFVTVPTIFAQMAWGSVYAALFFGLLFFAAFLSAVAAFEVLVTTCVDTFHWPRIKTAAAVCVGALLAGIVSMRSLDYILTSDLFWGSTMQPLGSALSLVGLAWVVKLRKTLDAVNEGNEGRPVGPLWYYWIKYVVPVGVGVILVLGLDDLFGAFLG
ncbi:MAG: sodium-dependent transporter [Gemmatimonadetes bacterium]|nr:sodium-dependent transporter [Gemmatimonadota bacterium]